MKSLNTLLLGMILLASGQVVCADTVSDTKSNTAWSQDFIERFFKEDVSTRYGVSAGKADWTIDGQFVGQVVILKAQHTFVKNDQSTEVDENGFATRYYAATLSTDIQKGAGGLEYYYVNVTPLSIKKVKSLQGVKGFHLVEKGMDFAGLQIDKDLPLGVKEYEEFSAVQVYGTFGWELRGGKSAFLAKLTAAIGYAHAEMDHDLLVKDAQTESLSNTYRGARLGLSYLGQRCGTHFAYRVDKGLQVGSQEFMTREGRVFISEECRLNDKLSVGITVEKRSFQIGKEPEVDGYNKARRYLLEVTRRL